MDPLGLGAIAGKFAAGGGGGKGLGDVLPSHDQAEAGRHGLSGNLPEEYEAIRVGRYKLIEGIPGRVRAAQRDSRWTFSMLVRGGIIPARFASPDQTDY